MKIDYQAFNNENKPEIRRVSGASPSAHLGNIYLISETFSGKEQLTAIFKNRTEGLYYLPYKPVFCETLSQISDDALRKAVEKHGANLVMQVFMPDKDAPVFLMQNVEESVIGFMAIDLMDTAERYAGESVRAAIFNFAVNSPSECQEWLDHIEIDEHDSAPAGLIAPRGPAFRGHSTHTPSLSTRQISIIRKFKDARDKFVTYVRKCVDNPFESDEERSKVNDVLNTLSEGQKNALVKMYLKQLNDEELQDFFYKFLDTETIPKKSKIRLLVESNSDCQQNKGFYRLFCEYDKSTKIPLHFKHKSSFIVYLMLLDHRKNHSESGDVFSFEKGNLADKQLFVTLMMKSYEKKDFEAEADYYNLFKDDDSGAQGRLKDYIADCRQVLDAASVNDLESSYTFIPQKVSSKRFDYTIPILPENIQFDASLTDLIQSSRAQQAQ